MTCRLSFSLNEKGMKFVVFTVNQFVCVDIGNLEEQENYDPD